MGLSFAGSRLRTEGWSPGEWGGVIAGIVAGAVAAGKGFAWLMAWLSGREETKAKKLQVWEDSLNRREREQREQTEKRLSAVEQQVGRLRTKVGALRYSLIEVTVELRAVDPNSVALSRAAKMLRTAFPPEMDLPDDVVELARMLDE